MSWGYMGKAPARGDFVTQHVQPEVRDAFFEWCQASMAVSRDQLGEAWIDAYLTAPIWHFSAAPSALTERGLVGTMIPSVDRVGRHFPFIVVQEFDGHPLDAWREPQWSSDMEDRILAILDDGWVEDEWSCRLKDVQLPVIESPGVRWPGERGNLVIPGGLHESDWLNGILGSRQGLMIWWTQGSGLVDASVLLSEGLPKVGQYAAMMAGHWSSRGWSVASVAGA